MLAKFSKIKKPEYVAGIILFLAIIVGISIYNYEREERCFVDKLNQLKNEDVAEEIDNLIQSDDKKMVLAKAKVLANEYKNKDLSGKSKTVYLNIKVALEYCNIKL